MEIFLLFILIAAAAKYGSNLFEQGGGEEEWGANSPEGNAAAAAAAAAAANARAEQANTEAQTAERAKQAPVPWPVSLPAGLPPFPAGWEYSEPPSNAIRTRAWQLLQPLWQKGQGATQTEQTEGNWITYRAEITHGNKHGVVAYRLKRARAVPAPAALPNTPGAARAPTPTATPSSPAPAPSSSAPVRPVLHQGSGMGALVAQQPWVLLVQRGLQIPGPDGKFGPHTMEAVKVFQRAQGLEDDGVVGPQTWAAFDRAHPIQMAS